MSSGMVREPGVEPGPLAGQDPKSCASASSATLASCACAPEGSTRLRGVGDVRGAVLAALILGVAETAVASLIDPGMTLAATYALFVLTLLFRPQGMFGKQSA